MERLLQTRDLSNCMNVIKLYIVTYYIFENYKLSHNFEIVSAGKYLTNF